MTDISIIIPVYNASALIKRCLDSILAQRGGYSYEVLLVDDGSTDDSVAIIESYKNPCFKIFRQKNAGPSVARNKGVKEAQGRFLKECMSSKGDYPQFEGKMFGGLENYLYICSVIFE